MIPHNTKNSVKKVNKFKESDEERFSQLCDLENKLIDEVIVAMKNNDATTFGLKMSDNQKYLEEIQISNDTLRGMISSLKEISLGTKITGAGDGGCGNDVSGQRISRLCKWNRKDRKSVV